MLCKIEFSQIELTDKKVVVQSSSTTFVSEYNIDLDPDGLLEEYKSVAKLARQLGVKISYRLRLKHTIISMLDKLKSDLDLYKSEFQSLRDGWEKLTEKGLKPGFIDDLEYQRLTKISARLNSMLYGDKPLSQALGVQERIRATKKKILSLKNTESHTETRVFL